MTMTLFKHCVYTKLTCVICLINVQFEACKEFNKES